MQDGKRKSMFIDSKILMLLQSEGWNRVLAFLLHGPRSGEIHSQELTSAVTAIPQGNTGFAGEAGEQRVVQEKKCLIRVSRHLPPC